MLNKLKENFLFFDGAMGTMLQSAGLKAGELPESYNIKNPHIIYSIHKQYLEAGSDIITTNTFGANRLKLKDTSLSVEQVIYSAVNIAKKAVEYRDEKYIALSIGPIGTLLKPLGTLSFQDAYEIFQEQIIAGVKAGVDLILIETMADLYEIKAAILAAKENSNLPIFCTMTFQDGTRTFTGTDVITMVSVLEGLGVDALGVNCSTGPKEIQVIIEDILKYTQLPIIVQPNAGLPKIIENKTYYDLSPEDFSEEIKSMAKKGVTIFGGCCGTTPEYIRSMKSKLKGLKPNIHLPTRLTTATSASKTIVFDDEVKIIGERINPTGKKNLEVALKENNIDYILREAILQQETGSHILDINVGLPEVDEKYMMVKVISEIQSVLPTPLQIDSSKKEVIEAAARIYNGKPIINSVNGKKSSMDDIFPIVKKYGALVIALTLDEDGIPTTAEKRVEIATNIIEYAKKYEIPEENILIDPLVLTASAEQESVLETLRSIPLIKSKYNVKIVLGTSNVSFGLPNRNILNTTYLALALGFGLDAPITDSTNHALMDTIRAYKVLANQDKNCQDFLNIYGSSNNVKYEHTSYAPMNLDEIIIKGLKEEANRKTRELLNNLSSIEIVNKFMIPALDIVGEKYDSQEIFLPQLIRSAETAKEAFEAIKDHMTREGVEKTSTGKILLATVQGDIHDIGKNIVKLILENYGFDVIDLGKDVPIQTVVDTVKNQNIKLVGLSALMTTTVKNMEDTIKALKREGLNVPVVVGGAVLTPEYANMIEADYYAKDAKDAVDIAKEILQ